MKKNHIILLCLGLLLPLVFESCSDNGNTDDVPVCTYKIVNIYPHDPEAFTQGLVFEDGFLYEGTGLNSRSTLRRVELETGSVLQQYELPDQYFGEGITIAGSHIVQLTWTSRTGFIYDKTSFELLRDFSYPHEGWGITFDGTRLIVSDGTATLRFLDPVTLQETGRVYAHTASGCVDRLNELEYVGGEIFANIWQTDRIARIDPATGRITGLIDLTGLLAEAGFQGEADVLNGIAHGAAGDRLFVTGKLWPYLFEIALVPAN
jgi:glutamine cyclotransferase